ncbi:MAG: metal ABC transporter ATP-binding protein [Phaeodactylibacter sp.]|uniref:metal ABC transporter ATP-binding protein n=1 Tax=Phaeodactylibacter sp. TaxID=1940289 RepID=UPI0032EF8014
MNTAIETHNLTVAYNRRPVLWDIDFEVPEGQLIGVLGPNGSGKTTLLKSIMNLVQPSSGYVRLFGQSLDAVRSRISYVPQRESVDWDFPISVREVALMGRYRKNKLLGRLSKTDRKLADEALDKVGMLPFANRQIAQLSGGQQQRVFVARSLAQQADLYLMDEPFAGVDAASEEAILTLLKEMKQAGKTVLIVHHDLQTAHQFFDWIVLLNTRLIKCGPTASVFTTEYLQQAYGGQLTILSQVSELVKAREFPIRESSFKDQPK